MNDKITIKINFKGGIISPGDLYNIMVAASKAKIDSVSFGLRQQLFMDVMNENYKLLVEQLHLLGVFFEVNSDSYPNISSSYPAEEIFITKTWLSEGVYKDIFDLMEHRPRLKINISDSNQSITPNLTGNINWVASPVQHFWHLFIRFPKTNVVYEWKEMLYTNDLPRMSKHIEELIFANGKKFIDNPLASGDELFDLLTVNNYITKTAEAPAKLPGFNLPYYEGLNRYQDKFWLGIYRRDEMFSVSFLKELCQICLQTKIGQICSTPWKSIIIKNIESKTLTYWNNLLAKHLINVRHAANELNFQVEDHCDEGLQLKNFLVKYLHEDDTRTFGICFGIKTRKKSEVFSNILVRKRPLISLFGFGFFHVYDILCAKDFNPNERTGSAFSTGNFKFLLPEQLRRAILSFYSYHDAASLPTIKSASDKKERPVHVAEPQFVYQCSHCLSVYDEKVGDPSKEIPADTSFDVLPSTYTCDLCDASKADFVKKNYLELGLQAI